MAPKRTFSVKPAQFGTDKLLFSRMTGHERVSELFEFRVDLLSEDGAINADDLLGYDMTVNVDLLKGGTRYFNGVVTEFTQIGFSQRYHHYTAVLRPSFWYLTRTADCRTFQEMTVTDIIEKVMHQMQLSNYKLKLQHQTQVLLDYCVQYRETDFNFLSRMFEHEGIYYYFEHSAGGHQLVLADDASVHQPYANYEEIEYLAGESAGSYLDKEHLFEWSVAKQVLPGTYATTDFDYTQPKQSLRANSSITRQHGHASYEVFDYPAELGGTPPTNNDRIAKLRIEELQAAYMVARGYGDAAGLAPGCKFKLKKYPRDDLNMEYLVLGAQYLMSSNAYASGAAGGGDAGEMLSITIEAIDARTPYRPPRLTPKPVVHGSQTAMVVGETHDEICTDKLGRCKVQFPWDRQGKNNEKSSFWIRVAQLWAGDGFGALFLPRVGQEVIVDFLEGDPDRPIITGRVYNGTADPPYSLPDDKTQSGIKTRSSTGGSSSDYHELRFEDKKGSELVLLHSQKDFTLDVTNDGNTTIGNNQNTEIKKKLTTKVDDDEERTIAGNLKVSVTKNENHDVSQDRTTTISGNDKNSVNQKYSLAANDQVSITAGMSSITMKSNGEITINGDKITLSGISKVAISALEVEVSGTTKTAVTSQVQLQLQGLQTTIGGTMVQLSGDAMAQLKGGITMIG